MQKYHMPEAKDYFPKVGNRLIQGIAVHSITQIFSFLSPI